ncbi:hypothetical protein ACFFQW_34590 [Umezawaea endophytica]|uniref:Double-GTPase 2 domain-containing protein n=1 Tax=Umezawaea endophytica TaxID=1654476 RepID=A0A9X2VJL8_9PSEU|nr:hypothetical protein [Umezawaea endophytica]MCS7477589.1 hypothetical protein [Umezawaea endophytica]
MTAPPSFGLLLLAAVLVLPVASGSRFGWVLLRQYVLTTAAGYGVGANANAAKVKHPPGKRGKGEEPAWVHYLLGQAWRDIRHVHTLVARELRDVVVKRWKAIGEKYSAVPAPRARWWGGVQRIGIFTGIVMTAPVLVLTLVGSALFLGLLLAASCAGLYLLRLFDTTVLRLRGIRMTCKTCGVRVVHALHGCPGCKTLHGEVRPGRYGMTHRRCGCGKVFPSLLVLTALVRKPEDKPVLWCPHAETPHPLAERTGETGEIVLPVFGAPSAGKSQLTTVLLIAVETMATRAGGAFTFADTSTKDRSVSSRGKLASTARVDKTSLVHKDGVVHPAYSTHVAPKRGQHKLVHVFDVAGEVFRSSTKMQELEYLKIARTFLFVIDPLSIKSVWETFEGDRRAKLDDGRAKDEPHVTFTETVTTMTEMGVATTKARLAVVISKSDLIRHVLDDVDEEDSEAIKSWLDGLSQGNMVRAMDHNFKDVTFFLTSALLNGDGEADHSVERFAERVLADEGLRL